MSLELERFTNIVVQEAREGIERERESERESERQTDRSEGSPGVSLLCCIRKEHFIT